MCGSAHDSSTIYHRSVSVIYSRQAFVIGDRPWCPHRQSVDHSRPRCRYTPVMSVPGYQLYVSCEWSGHHWPWKQQKLWCMHSSAADLITATVCYMESAIVCWQSCRLLRSSARHYWNQEVRLYHFSCEWSSLASGLAASMVYKCLHGLAPSYLADVWSALCTPVSVVGRWQLQSANSGTLVAPGTVQWATIGQRNFTVSGRSTWNRLSVELRTSSLSIDTFAKSSISFV